MFYLSERAADSKKLNKTSLSFRLLAYFFSFCFPLLLTACSFQAHSPAPVVSLNAPVKNSYHRGGLTSDQYKVKPGDTLYSISWAANKDFVDIARNNGLKKPYTIYPGQVLKLNLSPAVTNKKKGVSGSNRQSKVVLSTNKVNNKQSVNTKNTETAQNSVVKKKSLDPQKKPAYSDTTSQQNINGVIHKPKSTLPKKVYRWMWPVKGKLISRFSAKEQGNKGIRIAGSRGERIQAAADGRVVYAGSALRGYGNLVIIKHSDDYLSAYAHTDKILVKEKQFVTAGQAVATMGNTGTDRVMLHFEIRYHGQSVDPLKYLPK
ncbi:peptidoglycan DD-metalloendopeptidase family protein [Shewanella sp. AS1]|uniref:peptidoglycan DD-metalloendopeptidase family protein n=1 Tax=Shewanella sp. AS1 TaxID=2907626 RepID=UPI001F30F795|nr:peptidoglycan DD-metalloendopeptidase family protein [Shewanella sp. AS1]MCE9678088.1 peptidoglycan DD-metalloendopeptidase family protein [Shewanella sp. AS1]